MIREGRKIVVLAAPLIANNLAFTTMSLTDTIMAGQISALDLGAVGVAAGLWVMVFLFGLGLLMALNPLTAHEVGAGRPEEAGLLARQSAWVALALAALVFLVLRFSDAILSGIGIAPELLPKSVGYMKAISWGLPGAYLYLSLRFTSEGIGHTFPVMLAAILGMVVNLIGNYVLMYGKLGFPAMGAIGCGWASAIALTVMFVAKLIYVVRRKSVYRELRLFERFDWPQWARLRVILALGLPIGGSVLAEVGMFSTVAFIMGRMGTLQIAAHQIAINYAATMFMVPLAVHSATTVRVGQALGRGHERSARLSGATGIVICGLFMTLSALVMLVFRDAITGWYTNDEAVREIALGLLVMAAAFQVSDGVQVGAAGALRGFKDTQVPFAINLFSFWVIGFPLAYLAGITLELGPQWVWGALALSLAIAAVLLTLRFWRVVRAGQAAALRATA